MYMTHHLQGDLGLVDEVIVLSHKQKMALLSHYEHDISRDGVWSLRVKYSKLITMHIRLFP